MFTPDKFAQPDYKLEDAVTPLSVYFLCIEKKRKEKKRKEKKRKEKKRNKTMKEEKLIDLQDIGVAAFALSYMETGFWMLCGERQIRRVRENYLRAVLCQVDLKSETNLRRGEEKKNNGCTNK